MAVTVADTRTTWDDAESTTGWTQTAGTGPTAGTTVFAEATNSIIGTLNIATGQIYFTTTAVDLSDTLIYVWSNNFALQGLWDATEPPNALHLGDGTEFISFKMAGINRKVFVHLDAGAGINADWDCLVLDGSQAGAMDTAGLTVERTGLFTNLDLTNITDIGSDFTTLSKGLGGGVNVAVDIIRYGNDGLRITAGTTGDRGTFLEIVTEDSSSADAKAHGIIRELSTGLYSCQGPLNFGTTAAATDSFFEDTGRVLSFEDRNISDDKYYIAVTGHASATNLFSLTNSTITTAGPLVTLNFDGGNVNTLLLDSNAFVGLGNAITFSNLADASGHTVTNNSFTGCGQIDPGDVTFTGNTIADTTNADGGLLIDPDGVDNLSDLTFVSDGTGHAIHINLNTASLTELDLSGMLFDGYAYNDGTAGDRVFLIDNALDGDITINLTNSDAINQSTGTTGIFSYEIAAGYTGNVIIQQAVTLTLTGIETDSEVRIINLDDIINFNKEISGAEQISGSVTSATIVDGGSGYTNGTQTLTVVGGTGTAAQVSVEVVGNVVDSINSITVPGSYTANPPTPATTSGGGGTGATLRLNISGEHAFAYDGGLGINVAIIVFHLNFREVRIEQVLPAITSSIPIQQSVDRTYNNP